MVCRVPRDKGPRKPTPDEARPVGDPQEVSAILEALRSPDPAVRREAARLMEVSSLGALNAAEEWRSGED